MEHWKFLLPWYALLFPVSQLTLWCYLMRTILSDEHGSPQAFCCWCYAPLPTFFSSRRCGKARSFT